MIGILPPRCVECGYDLRGSAEVLRCPECGFDYARPILFARPEEPLGFRNSMFAVLTMSILLVVLIVLAFAGEQFDCFAVSSCGLIVMLILTTVLLFQRRYAKHFPVMLMIANDGFAARSILTPNARWQRWEWRKLREAKVVRWGPRVYMQVTFEIASCERRIATSTLSYVVNASPEDAQLFVEQILKSSKTVGG